MHIAGGVALNQVFINVDGGNLLSVAEHADVAQRAQLVDAAGSIQRIEGGRKAGEGVGAGTHDFAHHLDLQRADAAHGELEMAVAVALAELFLQRGLSLRYREAGQAHKAHIGDDDIAVGGDGLLHRLLAGAPDVDDYLVAGAQHIVGGRGNVLCRGEGEILRVEDIPAEHLTGVAFVHLLGEVLGVGGGVGTYVVARDAELLLTQFRVAAGDGKHLSLFGSLLFCLEAFSLAAHALQLSCGDTLADQVADNGALGGAFLGFLGDVGQNLFVRHALGHQAAFAGQEGSGGEERNQKKCFNLHIAFSVFLVRLSRT